MSEIKKKRYLLNVLAKNNAIKAFTSYMKLIPLSEEFDINNKLDYLKALDENSNSVLYYLLVNDFLELAKIYLKFIMEHDDFSIDDKLFLIDLDSNKKILYENFNKTKEYYIEFVTEEKQISFDTKIKLVDNKISK